MKNNSRESSSMEKLLENSEQSKNNSLIILTSPSDVGVMRNLGRNGSRHAPRSIISTLKKYNNHKRNETIPIQEVSSQSMEKNNFHHAQNQSALKIERALTANPNAKVIHIGGGHDHALPYLRALQSSKFIDNILILNIDAHCDTRVDSENHSGTPFRNFAHEAKLPFHIIQYGIQDNANSPTTISPLPAGSTEILKIDKIRRETQNFSSLYTKLLLSCPFEITQRTALFISLDCDAIDGSQMQAVSAVNGNGLPLTHIHSLLDQMKHLSLPHTTFGIYEFNPVYDNINQLGSRSIASLIYKFID